MYDEASKLSIILCNLKLKKERIIIRLIDKMQEFLQAYLKPQPAKKASSSFMVSAEVCKSFTISPLLSTTIRSQTSVTCIKS